MSNLTFFLLFFIAFLKSCSASIEVFQQSAQNLNCRDSIPTKTVHNLKKKYPEIKRASVIILGSNLTGQTIERTINCISQRLPITILDYNAIGTRKSFGVVNERFLMKDKEVNEVVKVIFPLPDIRMHKPNLVILIAEELKLNQNLVNI
jgi:hypothetical protein